MSYLIFILAALLILAGFVALTDIEAKRGARFFARKRDWLDGRVSRAQFILTHVDFGQFLEEELKRFGSRVSHDMVHVSLAGVRAIERLLTRAVKRLRSVRKGELEPREGSPRDFVKSLSDLKARLREAAENGKGEIKE